MTTTSELVPSPPTWFGVVTGENLEQGDIIRSCPVPVLEFDHPLHEGSDTTLAIEHHDLIVLSQTCDLVHEKVNEVLLARVHEWHALRQAEVDAGNQRANSTNYRKSLVEGTVPGQSLLRKHPPELAWSIVDFHRLHVLPKTFLSGVVRSGGDRLRLTSPYREHLSQAFARYFMRVGLPHEAHEFVLEGAPGVGDG